MFDLEKIKSNYENVIERNLISGIAIIKRRKLISCCSGY